MRKQEKKANLFDTILTKKKVINKIQIIATINKHKLLNPQYKRNTIYNVRVAAIGDPTFEETTRKTK